MNHHLIVDTGSAYEIKAGRRYVGYCDACTDPDGTGDSAVEFFGGTLSEIVEQYEDHVKWEAVR